MKTRTVVALAVPTGIAKMIIMPKMLYILVVMIVWLFAQVVKSDAGEYTRGRAGMDRGSTDHLTSDLQNLNDAMSRMSNNQAILDGVLAGSRASDQSMLEALHSAVGNIVQYDNGYDTSPADAGLVYVNPVNSGSGSPLHGGDGNTPCGQ